MKMKTYQADTMQEALSKVKEEMGPDAVILKSRKSTRKLNGRTQPCFEVTAALEEAEPARPAARPAMPASPARQAPAALPGRAAPALPERTAPDRRAPARAAIPGLPERRGQLADPVASADWVAPRALAGRIPDIDESTYDWKGSLRRVTEDGPAASGQGPAKAARRPGESRPSEGAASGNGRPADGGHPENGLLELLRTELREVKDKVDMPTREIQVLKKEIKAMVETMAGMQLALGPAREGSQAESRARSQSPGQINQSALATQPAAPAKAGPAALFDFASPGALPPDLRDLHTWLMEMDLDADLAAELAFASRTASVADAMSARIRTTGGVRLRSGKPATVALVGPTGAGKTTTLCKLAALAKMHQGKRVGILSADSFRMGANEQLELFGRTAGIPVRPLFSAADVAPALKELGHCDLILVDTAGRSHSHPEAWVELQALLRAVNADEIHLVLSCTTRMRELIHQAGLYGNLCRLAPACGVVFTKLDECVSLGCLYNLARRLDAPISYLCDGQVIPDHISLATPQSVAAKVLMQGKAAEEAWKASHPTAMAG